MNIKHLLAILFFPLAAMASSDHNGFDHNDDPYLKTFIKNPKQTLDINYQAQLMQQENWTLFTQQNPNWTARFNEQTGLPHNAYGAPVAMGISLDAQATAYGFLTTKLSGFNIPLNELVYRNTATNKKYHNVDYVQYHNGLEVLWSNVKIKMMKDGRIVQFMMDAYKDIALSSSPMLSIQAAQASATSGLNLVITGVSTDSYLKYLPVPNGHKNDYHLVYVVTVDATDSEGFPRKYYTLVDANNGEILYRQNRINYFASAAMDINVSASLYATNPYNPATTEPLKHLGITIGGFTYYTDTMGYLGVTNTTTVTSNVQLRGLWASVNTNGNIPAQTFTLNAGTNNLTYTGGNIKELSAYHSVQEIHDYYKAKATIAGTGAENVMDFVMTTNVDVAGSCNAFYNGTINFFDYGGTAPNVCNATSEIADVIYHEYGHGINYELYNYYGGNFGNGALGEGYADVWANGRTEDPVLGIGFFANNPTGYVRRYDINRKVYPQNLIGEVHADGEIIAGAWWDVGLNLMSHQIRQDLFFETQAAVLDEPDGQEGTLFSDILTETLLQDDNDGNLSNGTPNYCAITSAFALHGIFQGGATTLYSHNEVLQATGQSNILVNAVAVGIPAGGIINGYYRDNGTTAWTPTTFNNVGGSNFQATIPPYPNGTILEYYIDVADNCGTHFGVMPSRVTDSVPNIPYYIMVGYSLLDQDYFNGGNPTNWTVGLPTDAATTGNWGIDVPVASYGTLGNPSSICQTGTDHTPTADNYCAVTGNALPNDGIGVNDIDGGETTLISRVFDLSSYTNPAVTYWRWYTNDQGATAGTDFWQVAISNDGGTTWTPVENTNVADHSWRRFAFQVSDYVTPTANVQVRFIAEDANAGSLVEAAFDDFEVWDVEPTNIAENSALTTWYANPNPAKDVLNIGWKGTTKNITVQITDKIGRVVYSKNYNSEMSHQTIDLKNFANGIYIVRLTGDNVREMKKITVLK